MLIRYMQAIDEWWMDGWEGGDEQMDKSKKIKEETRSKRKISK